jgi:hypothetical protein
MEIGETTTKYSTGMNDNGGKAYTVYSYICIR